MKIQIFNRIHIIGLFSVFFMWHFAFGKINFGAQTSEIIIGDNSVLKVKPSSMQVNRGGINRSFTGGISGNAIQFDRGIFKSFNSASDISGKFIALASAPLNSGAGTFVLGDTPTDENINIIISNPGGLPLQQTVLVKPGASFLRGQPLFFGPNAITLTDVNTLLAFAIQNTLNTAVTMNGGIIFLEDHLQLGDQGILLGDGLVIFNNRRLSLGGSASVWNGTLSWSGADILMNSQTILNGVWFFVGDCQINGGGNVLDISNGGTIIVAANSRLRLSGVKLKGLGSGSLFMGDNAQIRLSGTDIEMDTDYTVNSGGIYVDGDSNIITQNHLFTIADSMDSHGSLTVDTVALTYDTQNFLDNINIRPAQINDPDHKYINIINNGSIRRIRQEPISFLSYSAGSAVQRYSIISPQRILQIFPQIDLTTKLLQHTFTIDGAFNFFGFTPANDPIMFVSDHVNVKYINVYFRDFSPIHLKLGAHAKLVFGNQSTVGFARDETLNYPLVFEGTTFLQGGGSILTLEEFGALVLQGKNSSLTLEDFIIKGLSGNKIRCTDPTSKIIFKNVTMYQDNAFTFAVGAIDILSDLTLIGPYEFKYTATGPFRILPDATLYLARGKTFTYAPKNGNRHLLQMVDASSTIDIDMITLSAPAPGLQLIHGRLIEHNANFLQNAGGTSAANGIVFGDGTLNNTVIIQQTGGSSLQKLSGFFADETV